MAASHINRQVEIVCPCCLQMEPRKPYSDGCCGPKIGVSCWMGLGSPTPKLGPDSSSEGHTALQWGNVLGTMPEQCCGQDKVRAGLQVTSLTELNCSTLGHLSHIDGRTALPRNWCDVLDLNRFVFQAAWSSGLDDGKASRKQTKGGSTGKGGAIASFTVAGFPQPSPIQEVVHGAAWLQRLWAMTLEISKTLNL